jgi:tetraacyldisaccharide 4'-kinase|tara:strand:+ start:382 stop:1314 length:933 start_codon:yes stop_codon:yes gene_type:complete
MKIFKPKFWHKKNSLLSFLLFPLSLLLLFLINLKKILETKKTFSIPVICVGNIYIGGTGKTPLCIELAEILKKLNKKAAIIKKFYKIHDDEFKLIESKKIKLFRNPSRALSIKKALVDQFDCVILDDGFQDKSIVKDLNIICFHGEQLVGNGMTIPSGPLREPLSSLKDTQIIVINGSVNEVFEKKIKAISSDVSIYYSEYLPTNLRKFENQNLLAFAGIGNPNNFFNILEKNKLQVVKKISFPDHYDYSIEELNDLIDFAMKKNLKIITTEKDYFRIKHHKFLQIQCLQVKLEIKNRKKFEKEVVGCLL